MWDGLKLVLFSDGFVYIFISYDWQQRLQTKVWNGYGVECDKMMIPHLFWRINVFEVGTFIFLNVRKIYFYAPECVQIWFLSLCFLLFVSLLNYYFVCPNWYVLHVLCVQNKLTYLLSSAYVSFRPPIYHDTDRQCFNVTVQLKWSWTTI